MPKLNSDLKGYFTIEEGTIVVAKYKLQTEARECFLGRVGRKYEM